MIFYFVILCLLEFHNPAQEIGMYFLEEMLPNMTDSVQIRKEDYRFFEYIINKEVEKRIKCVQKKK